ncbi:MAG TPA: ATP-dependent protease [Chromatiaceae bacterium]|nr:ATP-dependent protease [Chromatiaceae bacterium]
MSLATTYCRASVGIEAPLVTVEVHLANGLPAFAIVGLAEKAVQESRDRVRSALINSGYEFPARRITVNLAPADLPKDSGRFDLPIAIGILAASGQIPADALQDCEFTGELNLSGDVRPVTAALPVAIAARDARHKLFLPIANLAEASLIQESCLYPVEHLLQLSNHLCGRTPLEPALAPINQTGSHADMPDLADVRGQSQAKRALIIAAAGAHNLLFSGPPGSGKSMLASRLPGILPPMTETQALEHAMVQSISGLPFDPAHWKQRPFRHPHHTASAVALVGGGSDPRPGEISLSHAGILFLDEIAEFPRGVLDVLREPLETGHINISRANRSATYPARFQLVAAMNPCPCGHLGDPIKACRCTAEQVARYQGRISGPLLDRIDLQVQVPAQPAEAILSASGKEQTSSRIREKVIAAHELQLQRQGCNNAHLQNSALDEHCRLDESSRALLIQAMDKLGLSARAYHRILRVARTIADLEQIPSIQLKHVTEAIGYRRMDRAG